MKQPVIFDSLTAPKLVEFIRSGAVGVLATDTVYGLVASAHHQAAVARMYGLKHREQKPGTTVAASIEQLIDLGIAPDLLASVSQYWPGSLSVILKPSEQFAYIHQEMGNSPFRVVAPDDLRALLQKTGPLVTTSANKAGEQPVQSLAEAQACFGSTVDFYVDGGNVADNQASTIVRITEHGLEVIRQGVVRLQA